MEFLHRELDNGLEVIAERNPRAYSAALGFFVRAGARDESPQLSGVSHFLEHMMFKGTARRSAADINREIDEIGAHSNAFTSEEQTVYYANFVPDYQEKAVDLLCDMMRPALRAEDFEVEKKVIVEEIHKYDDQPPFGAHEKCMATFFGSHPLARNVLGTVESVTALTPELMRAYFEQRYSPTNLKLVAAGNIDFERLVADTDRITRDWQPCRVDRDLPAAAGISEVAKIHRAAAVQEYILQIASAPDALHPLRFAHRLMTFIFGDDCGSRLFWEFVDSGDAEFASSGTAEYENAGATLTYLACDPEATSQILSRLASLQQQIEADGVTEDELELARSKVCSQVVRRAERPANRLFTVGNNWLQRRIYRSLKDSLNSYQEVTVGHIRDSLEMFPMSHHAMVLAGPLP